MILAVLLIVLYIVVGDAYQVISPLNGLRCPDRCTTQLQHSSKGFGFAPKMKTISPKNVILQRGSQGQLKPGVQSPRRVVPAHIIPPPYALDPYGRPKADRKSQTDIDPTPPEDIELMREAGVLAREVLDAAIRSVRPGITTDFIDNLVHEETIKRNCYPSPLGYNGFPKSCCTSLNEVICHGIPDTTVMVPGDIINIDVTLFHKGRVHADCSETILVPEYDAASPSEWRSLPRPKQRHSREEAVQLIRTCYDAWQAAIAICKPGVPYHAIGKVIEDIATVRGCWSVREFCGHGVNSIFHTTPTVVHYATKMDYGVMQPGHTFTIEPMLVWGLGGPQTHKVWSDNWTTTTTDGRWSAQFEHTLCITETGVDVLTKKLPTSPKYFWEMEVGQ